MRPVSLPLAGRVVAVCLAIIGWVAPIEAADVHSFRTRSVEAPQPATVTASELRDGYRGSWHKITVSYVTVDGQQERGQLRRWVGDVPQAGDRLRIRYLPADPAKTEQAEFVDGYAVVDGMLVCGVIGNGLLVRWWWRQRGRRRLGA